MKYRIEGPTPGRRHEDLWVLYENEVIKSVFTDEDMAVRHKCIEQLQHLNKMDIEEYEHDPLTEGNWSLGEEEECWVCEKHTPLAYLAELGNTREFRHFCYDCAMKSYVTN